MSLYLVDLSPEVRRYMVEEMQMDLAAGKLYISARLNDFGVKSYPSHLETALRTGTDGSFAASLIGCFHERVERRTPSGGTTTARVPANAHETLAEGEMNRFFIRGLCRLAIDEGLQLEVYRAKDAANPRPESTAKVGATVDPKALLSDLRDNIGVDTVLGLPAGPNSGLSIRIRASA